MSNIDFVRKQLRKAYTTYIASIDGPEYNESRVKLSEALYLCKLAGLNPEAEFAALQG